MRRPSRAIENGYNPGERLIVAHIAGEDDEGHADRLGCGVGRPEYRDQAGKQLASYLSAPDPQAMHGDVVGSDPALGDDPGGPGGQRPAGDAGQGAGDGAGDGQVIQAVAGAHDSPARVEQDIRAAKRGDNLPCRRPCRTAAARDDRRNVELDARDLAAGQEIGHLPGRLRDM